MLNINEIHGMFQHLYVHLKYYIRLYKYMKAMLCILLKLTDVILVRKWDKASGSQTPKPGWKTKEQEKYQLIFLGVTRCRKGTTKFVTFGSKRVQ